MTKRIFLIVLDSLGAGALPDASDYGDENANTLRSISKSPFYRDDKLRELGLSSIEGLEFLKKDEVLPRGSFGRLAEKSKGKDTTTGHWEIAGLISEKPFPTYPDGFPKKLLDEFSKKCGRGVICNRPYSGTEVIKDYGAEHMKSGDLIVYTSADSVFQIAAHEDIVPVGELYDICRIARELLSGENGVGRVIARPFTGDEKTGFRRTEARRDFSLEPTGKTMLDALVEAGLDVISVGKISDIFAGRGITRSVVSHGNAEGMERTSELLREDFHGICFVNLVDFDMLYGHRNDVDGYARALSEFDLWLCGFTENMREGDVLIITADHGCDPGDLSTDHTREYVPILIYGDGISENSIGTRESFSDIAATVCDMLGVPFECPGKSFRREAERI